MKIKKHESFEGILKMVRAGVAPMMVGPAGSGKTTIARQIAEELGVDFYYTGAVESAAQLKGFKDAHGNTVKMPFREAYEKGGVFLFDELDASDPQAIVAMHAALDNGYLDAPDGIIKQHPDFRYIAAGNTWGHGASLDYVGRNALDGATLDRYAVVEVNYDTELEKQLVEKLVGDTFLSWVSVIHQARQAIEELELRHILSTRAAINGAKLLNAEMSFDDVFNSVVLKGLNKDQATKLAAKVDKTLTEFEANTSDDALSGLRDKISNIEDISKQLKDRQKTLKQTLKDADKTSEDALSMIKAVAKEITEATEASGDLKRSIKMLEGNREAAEAVSEMASASLERLKKAKKPSA
jgi:AAA+ ATPase superfamily predicted ATPase